MYTDRLRLYFGKLMSPVFTAAMAILTIPLTLAALIIMMCTSVVAAMFLRYRLRNMHIAPGRPNDINNSAVNAQDTNQKPPIEGSYSVVDK